MATPPCASFHVAGWNESSKAWLDATELTGKHFPNWDKGRRSWKSSGPPPPAPPGSRGTEEQHHLPAALPNTSAGMVSVVFPLGSPQHSPTRGLSSQAGRGLTQRGKVTPGTRCHKEQSCGPPPAAVCTTLTTLPSPTFE